MAEKEQVSGKVILSDRYEQYEPKTGEYWYSIVSAKYGADSEEAKEIVRDLKAFNGIDALSLIVIPNVMKLPQTIHLGMKTFTLDSEKNVDIRNFRLNAV